MEEFILQTISLAEMFVLIILFLFFGNCNGYDYRNFRSFTLTADYPHRPIIAYGEEKSQQITRTGG